MLAVDGDGDVVDGDELIALAALHLHGRDRLPGGGVAVTVMTNYGFHTAMGDAGVEVATTAVGDRYVLDELRRRGWALGGEQSGHIIDLGFGPSGDGIASALLTLEALDGRDLRERDAMEKLPQRLVNIRAADRAALISAMEASDAGRWPSSASRRRSPGRGRVLVRASGTEPLIRVMVEAPSQRGDRRRLRSAGRGRQDDPDRRIARMARRAPLTSRDRLCPSRPTGQGQVAGLCPGQRYPGGIARCAASSATSGPGRSGPLLCRGWRSSNIAAMTAPASRVLDGDRIDAVRAVGNLSALRARDRPARRGAPAPAEHAAVAVAERPEPETGIGHTRWATHGRVTEENAHPHYDTTDSVHIVVNGIVENYIALKARLMEEGRPPAVFTSETDAEVIAHLVAHHYDGDLLEAVRAAYAELRGHYAFVAMSAREPGVLVGARKECPLIVGRGDGEKFIASAIPAFLRETRRVQYIDDDEIVVLRPEGAEFFTAAGEPVEREVVEIDWDADTAEKQGYETFMLKEIHEQADAVAETIGERAARGWGIDLGDLTPPGTPNRRHRRRSAHGGSGGWSSSPAAPPITPA